MMGDSGVGISGKGWVLAGLAGADHFDGFSLWDGWVVVGIVVWMDLVWRERLSVDRGLSLWNVVGHRCGLWC